jgi:hypothetical protein
LIARTDTEARDWVRAIKSVAESLVQPVPRPAIKLNLPSHKIVFIAGATGTIGAPLVDELLKKKHITIRAGTRDPSKYTTWKKQGVEVVEYDMNKPDTIDRVSQATL